MGSKRTKNLSNAPSSLPPADSPPDENSQIPNKNPSFPSPSKFPKKPLPPADSPPDENSQNPNKNPSFPSPSKFPKKPKPSAPMSTDSSFASPFPSAVGDAPSQKTNRKRKDAEIPAKASAGGAPFHRWSEDDKLKLLRAMDAFRSSNGMLPAASHMPTFVKEMKDYVPFSLSEKTIHSKIRHLHSKFVKYPKPGPESSEFDRSFYELASKVWGSDTSKANGSAIGDAKGNPRIDKFLKKQEDKADVEGEDQDKSEDVATGEKAKVDMELLETGEKYEKEDLLDNDEAGCPYKYLKHALEEFWLEKKLDMDTLYAALPKVEPGKAELLDKQLAEIYEEETKFEMEKINLTNEILCAMLDHLVGGRRYGA